MLKPIYNVGDYVYVVIDATTTKPAFTGLKIKITDVDVDNQNLKIYYGTSRKNVWVNEKMCYKTPEEAKQAMLTQVTQIVQDAREVLDKLEFSEV